MGELNVRLHPACWPSLRTLLDRGTSPDELRWAIERNVLPELAGSTLRVNRAREIISELDSLQMCSSAQDLEEILCRITSPRDAAYVQRWLTWLRGRDVHTLSSAVRLRVRSTFIHSYLPAMKRPWHREAIERWFAAEKRQIPLPLTSIIPPFLVPLLQRTAAYQAIVGQEPTVPKSVRKCLDQSAREERELRYLSNLSIGSPDEIAAALQKRCSNLQARLQKAENSNAVRLTRLAREAIVTVACESLDQMLVDSARKHWEATTRTRPPHEVVSQMRKYTAWLADMNESQRWLLSQVLAAWEDHGSQYKQKLPKNHDWLAKADQRGINIRAWLRPRSWQGHVNSFPVRIAIEANPWKIFTMGERFGTCLGFGGCNQMSLLPNAHDANKQVVFMTTTDASGHEQTLARQLIAIGGDFQLLGYHCYIGLRNQLKAERSAVLAAMAGYCGHLAKCCGLQLGEEGGPETLSLQWYDDGVWKWHAAAKEARAEPGTTIAMGPGITFTQVALAGNVVMV
jgi:hypothetical protein